MLLTLTRTICASDRTEGTLRVATASFKTMELPWRDNLQDKSCVPLGTYDLEPYVSIRHGQTWRLHNPDLRVWGTSAPAPAGMRTEVELHSGNWARQSLGCLLIGSSSGELLDPQTGVRTPAILGSDAAIAELRRLLGSVVTHMLQIVSAP